MYQDPNPFDEGADDSAYSNGGARGGAGAGKSQFQFCPTEPVGFGGGGRGDAAVDIPLDNMNGSNGRDTELSQWQADLRRREADIKRREEALKSAGVPMEDKNWPPFFPVIHHDIANEIPANAQRLQYLAFASWLGKPPTHPWDIGFNRPNIVCAQHGASHHLQGLRGGSRRRLRALQHGGGVPSTIAALRAEKPFYAVGPNFPAGFAHTAAVTTAMWAESDCSGWLDAQPAGSVLYISFGSYAHITREELREIAGGVAASGARFLCVMRPGIVSSKDPDPVPPGLPAGRGLVVPWCCHAEVLSHAAVDGKQRGGVRRAGVVGLQGPCS